MPTILTLLTLRVPGATYSRLLHSAYVTMLTTRTACRHPDYFDAANEGLDLTFDKDRRRGTDLEGEGKRLERPNIG